jgi:hypothetical protein
MNNELDLIEIESVANRLRRRGEYEEALSDVAAAESDRVGALLQSGDELDDATVQSMLSTLQSAVEPEPEETTLRGEVQAALRLSAGSHTQP